jgi:hypothetical protein
MITLTEEQFKEMIEAAHRAGQHNQGRCDPSAYEAMVYYEREVKKLIIPVVSKRFSVNSYSIIDTEGSIYMHWSEGLNMIIEKDGIVMKLNSDEIQQIVKALPRTVGGRY